MRSGICHILFAAVISLLSMLSCNIMPDLHAVRLPEFVDVSAVSTYRKIDITATLDHKTDIVAECGFILEQAGGGYQKRLLFSQLEEGGDIFTVSVDNFKYNTNYVVSAFVGNGYNIVLSPEVTFKTSPVPFLSVSYLQENLSAEGGELRVDVTANVKYEVVIPDDVNWVSCVRSEDWCKFIVSANTSDKQRTCRVEFNSLDHFFKTYVTITQDK